MESADNPKSVSEMNNGLEKTVISGSFVIDMDNFSNKEISQNSRNSRNYSRKGILRGGNKMGQDHSDGDEAGDQSISPIGGGSSTLEKQAVVGREEVGGGGGGALSQEIPISSTQNGGGGGAERQSLRRNSFKRSPQPCSWYLDPRKIFLLCATLSCVGTMLLIYLAISSGMLQVEESELDS